MNAVTYADLTQAEKAEYHFALADWHLDMARGLRDGVKVAVDPDGTETAQERETRYTEARQAFIDLRNAKPAPAQFKAPAAVEAR